jgi:predicted Rossmann fold flavoprotein
MRDKIYDLIVIGGGPSGMMAGGRASELGARVLLIEKNKELGKKLSITGGGRCNITNAEFDIRKFLNHFKEAQNFLYSPFSKFSAKDTFEFFEKRKLTLVTESRKRAFPKSQNASDVMNVMKRYVEKGGVEIKLNTRVKSVEKINSGDTFAVKTKDDKIYKATNVAIATGGMSAPKTGSTGDGFKFLRKLGHTIDEPNPNVVPLKTNERWVHSLSGTSLSFMKISFIQGGKVRIKKIGKILFTHFGISGPLILNSAYEVKKLLENGKVYASIDLFPDTNEGNLDRTLWRLFEKNKNKKLKNIFSELIPESLAEIILNFPEVDLADSYVHSITKDDRKKIMKIMKNLVFEITGTLGFDKAVITDGGISLDEVNFKNMTSKLHKNLYLLGDVLNVNRPSGGFSLQLCWTTGWVAGSDIGEKFDLEQQIH